MILEFEKPIYDLTVKIEELKKLSEDGNIDLAEEIAKIERRASKMKKEIYANLSPNQLVQIARHIDRPDSLTLINLIADDFLELHGDRLFKDDPAIVGGLAKINNQSVIFIGHQKGHDTKSNIYRNFAMPNPEGYRKALRLMKIADKFNLPIITFVDTKGAYPGLEAEEHGQAEAIARNLMEMAKFKVPIITVIIGEGGSGGALGIAVANKLYMLEYAIYSVISPEGCASILFRDSSQAGKAAEALKITAKDIVKLGVADGIISEPEGGAHTDWEKTAQAIKAVLVEDLNKYQHISEKKILDERYSKFRTIGAYSQPMNN